MTPPHPPLPARAASRTLRAAIALAAFACTTATSAPVSAQTLAEAIARAYRDNPSLQAGRYDLRAADEAVAQADAELHLNAQLDLQANVDRIIEGDATASTDFFGQRRSTTNGSRAVLSITQPLYTGGRATADRRIADAGVRSERATLRGTEGDLVLSVIAAFVDVRRYGAALDVWKGSVLELEAIEREVEARRTAGELTRTDIAQAQAQLALAREQVVDAELSLEAARGQYAAVVGEAPAKLEPEPPLPRIPARPDDAFRLAADRNPELARTVFNSQASASRIDAARAQGAPTLSLRGTATASGQLDPYRLRDQDQDYGAGLILSIPLSAGGRIASQIREAQNRNGADRARVEEARRDLMRTVNDSWNQMVSAHRTITLARTRRGAAATQLEGMLAEYRVGLRSTFDVLYAQQSLRDADISLLEASRNGYLSEATLLRRIGLLEAGSLLTGVGPYDPDDHLKAAVREYAVPWDGPLRRLDATMLPKTRPLDLNVPHASLQPKMAAPAPEAQDVHSRSLPTHPIDGTVAVENPNAKALP